MSDGIVRICNAHQVELRLIGSTLVCPHGHECPTDWSVKEDMPYVDPRTLRPTCPLHGCRLTGSGSILDCQYGHKCTTRLPTQPKPEASMPVEKSTTQPLTLPAGRKRSSPGTVHPHGTHQRYWSGCKGPEGCQPCKDAVNKHVAARKAARLKAQGKPLPTPRVKAAPLKPRRVAAQAIATSLACRVPQKFLGVPVPQEVPATQSAELEARIHILRTALAAAEAAFLAHVATVVPNVEISRASAA